MLFIAFSYLSFNALYKSMISITASPDISIFCNTLLTFATANISVSVIYTDGYSFMYLPSTNS